MRCALGQAWNGSTCVGTFSKFTFDQAQQAPTQANAGKGHAGAQDWQVPTIRQLASLIACSNGAFKNFDDVKDGGAKIPNFCPEGAVKPTIHPGAFPGTPNKAFWSSSPSGDYDAWFVLFGYGGMYYANRDDQLAVRLVRASQLLESEAALVYTRELPAPELAWAEAKRQREAEDAARERKEQAERQAALRKTLATGAQAMYLKAAQLQRGGDTSEAARLYELIMEHFPKDPLAVKAADQLTAMGRTDDLARAARQGQDRSRQQQENQRAASRQQCEAQKTTCLAGCGESSYWNGSRRVDNQSWAGCRSRCDSISCY